MKADRFFSWIIDWVRLLFCKDKKSYLLLYSILGFLPGSLKPYRMALTHSSIKGCRLFCNERLEFLGDAVISSVTADFLYSKFHREREGFLSKSRSNMVCREQLNKLAIELGLDKLVRSYGVHHLENSCVYGNAFEALVGAVYIDKGYGHCRRFLIEKVFPMLGDINTVARSDNNHKSRLIEWSQKNHRLVTFELLREEACADGSCCFVSQVLVDGEVFGCGEGASKRASQQNASHKALEKIGC